MARFLCPNPKGWLLKCRLGALPASSLARLVSVLYATDHLGPFNDGRPRCDQFRAVRGMSDYPTRAISSPSVYELATALSVAVLIQPELIRAVRLSIFPYYAVDAEVDLWFSDLVWSRGSQGITFAPDMRRELQIRLTERISQAPSADPIHGVWEVINRIHSKLSPALLIEERVTWLALCGGSSQVEDALRPALKAVAWESRQGVAQWFRAAWHRFPDEARHSLTAWKLAQITNRTDLGDHSPLDVVPPIIGIGDVADIIGAIEDVRILVSRAGPDLVVGDGHHSGEVVGIMVPNTDPRVLEVSAELSNVRHTLVVRPGSVERVWVGAGAVQLQTGRGAVFVFKGMSDPSSLSCWTATSLETQPRIERGPGGMRVTLTVGMWCSRPEFTAQIRVQADYFEGGAWQPIDCDNTCPLSADELDRRTVGRSDQDWLEAQCLIADVRDRLRYSGNRYWEVVLADVPAGRLLRYRAVATIGDQDVEAWSDPHGLWLVAPEFYGEDLQCSRTPEPAAGDWYSYPDNQWWVLLRRDEPALDGCPAFCHLRVDLIGSTDPDDHGALPPVTISVGTDAVRETAVHHPVGRGWDDPPGPADLWPVVDRSADSVLLSVPLFDSPVGAIRIITGDRDKPGQRVDDVEVAAQLGGETTYRPTALMMIHYAIQGFNDLFERPVALYDPPRSFIDVTFEDDQGKFSGRPGRPEDSVPDGYVFALRAQAAYQIRTQWALNGGVLMLLKHGLSEEKFSLLADQIRSGLISPSNAGFGAHPASYYGRQANKLELELGAAMIDNLFTDPGGPPAHDQTYYPSHRLYLGGEGEVECYKELNRAGQLRYLVLDRSTVAVNLSLPSRQVTLFGQGQSTADQGNYLWKEARTGLTLLLIEDQFRDQLMAASIDEVGRGQLGRDLRRRFMKAVGSPANAKRKIYVYGDDLDHASGNGWFDGSYPGGAQIFYTRAYLAALRWIRQHPWVSAVTVSDADFAPEQYLQPEPITVSSAISPSVDPKGAEGFDAWGRAIHFDTWYEFWKTTRSPWLDRTLGELSDNLERALESWPTRYRDNGLYRLAWMYFLAYTHESMWSKQPLENGRPNDDRRTWEPEDFVISESLQQRGAWIYLHASIWASADCQQELAAGPDRSYVISRSTTRPAGHC